MKKLSSFKDSDLDRAKPKRHTFHSLINDKLMTPKKHRSQMGLVEDRTSSTTIVRIIVGLLLLHLIIIGGVLFRGHLVKGSGGVAVAPTITPPPPAPEQQPEAMSERPTPTSPVVTMQITPATESAPAPAPVAALPTHITQPVAELEEENAEEVAEPAAPEVSPTPVATPPTPVVTVRHIVKSGDTWGRVAVQYGVSADALKMANPVAAQKSMLISGTFLNVPVAADSDAGRRAAEAQQQQAAHAPKVHVMKKGETLGGIARKYKVSTKKLMEINKLTDKDARRLKVGTELKISE